MAQNNEAASSYDAVTRRRQGDLSSKEVPYRHFNNYVKKSLIQFALDSVHRSHPEQTGAAVLDLASGRGGDVGKWLFMRSPQHGTAASSSVVLHATYYECYDISPESINEAQRRFESFSGQHDCEASFHVADCFSSAFLTTDLRQSAYYGRFAVVSVQFAFHYACKDDESIRQLMEAVAGALEPGGVFIATTVDHEALSHCVKEGKCENSLYHIQLESTPLWECCGEGASTSEVLLQTGTRYHFRLEGFVDCPEYVVPLTLVRDCAGANGMSECTAMSRPFNEFLREYQADWKKHKGNGPKITPAERELVTLYRTMCFIKQ